MKENNTVIDKTFSFSLKVIEIYKYLQTTKHEYVMSKQLLRSATSIGANSVEADSAQSHKDFIAKMSIAFKEANETRYWIKLLLLSNYLTKDSILQDCEEIIKIITAILNTARINEGITK
jgi:four helix bundle protein